MKIDTGRSNQVGFGANPIRGGYLKQFINNNKLSETFVAGVEKYESVVHDLSTKKNIVLDLSFTLHKGKLDTYNFVIKPFENTCEHCKYVTGGKFDSGEKIAAEFPFENVLNKASELADDLESIHQEKQEILNVLG